MSTALWLRRIRNYAGFLGMILPWISLIGAALARAPAGFWRDLSISATYYVTPALPAILTTASVVLMCYDGYSIWDNIITTVSGVFGILIVLFPCNCVVATTLVGYFQVPVHISSIIHNTSACIFFILLAINNLVFFRKGDNGKKKKIYTICAIGMLLSMSLMIMPVSFPAKTFVVEALALSFFGISWLVKGHVFDRFIR